MSQPMTPSFPRPFGLRNGGRPADVATGTAPPGHGYRPPANESRSPGQPNLRTMTNEQREAYARMRQEQAQAAAQYTQSTSSAPAQMYEPTPPQSPARVGEDNGLGEMADDHMSADGQQFTRVFPALSRMANHHAAGIQAPEARESSQLLPPTRAPTPAPEPEVTSSSSSTPAPLPAPLVLPVAQVAAVTPLPNGVEITITGQGAARTIRIRLGADA